MGQRSQIYVSWQNDKGENVLVARYFQWNFAERMISRARGLIEELNSNFQFNYIWSTDEFKEKIARVTEINWDYRDIVKSCDIIKEYDEYVEDKAETSFEDYVFNIQDNNDGQLYIKVDVTNKKIKYGFLKYDMKSDEVMDCEEYMNWDCENWKHNIDGRLYQTCYDNFDFIRNHAELMTTEEIDAFRSAIYDYPTF